MEVVEEPDGAVVLYRQQAGGGQPGDVVRAALAGVDVKVVVGVVEVVVVTGLASGGLK